MDCKYTAIIDGKTYTYAVANTNRTVRSFINRVFAYLRANKELLEQKDYKKLYDECLILLKWLYRKDVTYKNQEEIFEIVIDLMVKKEGFGFDKEIVDSYLKFRIDAWNSGYYDKLFE